MSEKKVGKRTAMVIGAPFSHAEQAIKKTIEGVQEHKGKGGFKCALFVLVTDCAPNRAEATKKKLKKLAERHWRDTIMILTPKGLSDLSSLSARRQTHKIADHLADEVISDLIQQGEKPLRVGLIWDSDWPVWVAAGSAASAAMEDVCWWEPPGAPSMRLLPDRRLATRFKEPTGREDGEEFAILGESASIVKVREQLELFAPFPYPVLLIGETGTGKELCAHALHKRSGREGRFASINGAVLDVNLAQSALFGHTKGAYTGANYARRGRIMEAEGGTFFLDELSSVPLEAQSQLLRALQNAEHGVLEFAPVGGDKPKKVRARFVSALQRDPLIHGDIRPDLYYRVAGLTIHLPPLRERGDDVLLLSKRFLEEMNKRHGDGPVKIDGNVERVFKEYSWPGNVRELRRTIRQAWLQAWGRHSGTLSERDLPKDMGRSTSEPSFSGADDLKSSVANYVKAATDFAFASHPKNKTAAARSLGFTTGQALKRYREKHVKHIKVTDKEGGE